MNPAAGSSISAAGLRAGRDIVILGPGARLEMGARDEARRSNVDTRDWHLVAVALHGDLERIEAINRWSADQYADLEADVEVRGKPAALHRRARRFLFGERVWRESSLSRALQSTVEPVILLEGDPGAGKSIALRQVAGRILRRVGRSSWRTPRVLPLYVNLRELTRSATEGVDAGLISRHVMATLNRGATAELTRILEGVFEPAKAAGRWLFLFDGFDEIPEVLSSTDTDGVVQSYATAIHAFAKAASSSRVVVACRPYRRPPFFQRVRFRILDLSLERQLELVEHYPDLPADRMDTLIAACQVPAASLRPLLSNPMFLSLICDRARDHGAAVANTSELFDAYFERRCRELRASLPDGVTADTLGIAAQTVAFRMTTDTTLGLTPARQALVASCMEHQREHPGRDTVDAGRWDLLLNALVTCKIGRPGDSVTAEEFTFVHRRFQEHFAARHVAQHPELVSPHQLLTDAAWREAAVALIQSAPSEYRTALLDEAAAHLWATHLDSLEMARPEGLKPPFEWPVHAAHVLAILDAASARVTQHPHLDAAVDRLARLVRAVGSPRDLRWLLEAAGALSAQTLACVFPRGDEIDMPLLRDASLHRLDRLVAIPNDVQELLRKVILEAATGPRFGPRRIGLSHYLARLPRVGWLRDTLRLCGAVRLAFAAIASMGLGLGAQAVIETAPPKWRALQGAMSTVGSPMPVASPNVAAWLFVVTFVVLGARATARQRLAWAESSFAAKAIPIVVMLGASAILLTFDGGSPTALTGWLRLLCEVATVWTLSAIVVARNGRRAGVAFWPVLPVVALWEWAAAFSRRRSLAGRPGARARVLGVPTHDLVGVVLIGAGPVSLIVLMLLASSTPKALSTLSSLLSLIGGGGLLAATLAGAVAGVFNLFVALGQGLQRHAQTRRWAAAPPDEAEVGLAIFRAETTRQLEGYIRAALRVGALRPGPLVDLLGDIHRYSVEDRRRWATLETGPTRAWWDLERLATTDDLWSRIVSLVLTANPTPAVELRLLPLWQIARQGLRGGRCLSSLDEVVPRLPWLAPVLEQRPWAACRFGPSTVNLCLEISEQVRGGSGRG